MGSRLKERPESMTCWGMVCWNRCPLISLEGRVPANQCKVLLSVYLYQMVLMAAIFFKMAISSYIEAQGVISRLNECENYVDSLTVAEGFFGEI